MPNFPVRFLEGRLAGEVRILPYHVARPLIEARRVEAVEKFVGDRTEPVSEQLPTPDPTPPISTPRGKRKHAAAMPKTQ